MKKITTTLFLLCMVMIAYCQKPAYLEFTFPPTEYTVSFTEENGYFVWNDTSNYYAPYYFKLVEINPGQSPMQALEVNSPLYTDTADSYYVYYPWGAPDISQGEYAFQHLSPTASLR